MQSKKTDASYRVIIWNRLCLNCMGIWPLKVYDTVFVFFFVYLCIHLAMAVSDVLNHLMDMDYIFGSLTENLFLFMSLVKITLCRLRKNRLAVVLRNIEDDFSPENYKSTEERVSFAAYNSFTFKFIVTATFFNALTETLYFIMTMAINVKLVASNSSLDYQTPYRTQPIVEPHDDLTIYVAICAYQFLIVPIMVFGYIGIDSFFITLVLHVSSQFSVLSCRVKNAISELKIHQGGINQLVQRHHHLIRLVDILEGHFNILILQQMLGTTFHLCLSGYNTLMSTAEEQYTKLITFILISVCILASLLLYCYAGECLIKETTNFGEAFYLTEWYDCPPKTLKLVQICMVRTGKLMYLTSGKFCILSLSMFVDILKTSMAYLSLIRTMM